MQAKLFRRMILFAIAAVAYAALPAPQASAQYVHPLVAECRAAFKESTANTHCPSLTAHAVGPNSEPGGPSHTCWVWGSCTLTVQVNGSDTPVNMEIAHNEPLYLSPSELRLLDVCFAKLDIGGGQAIWRMKLRAKQCADGETDADTAKSEGLPAAAGSN